VRGLGGLAYARAMPTLGEVRDTAARLFSQGNPLAALRLYDAALVAAPLDLDSRIRVADCLTALAQPAAAAAVYQRAAWYAIKSGHPLPAIVCARLLAAHGAAADELVAGLISYYGPGSDRLGKVGARVAPPPSTIEVAVPDLRTEPPAGLLERIAHRAATATDDFRDYPEALHAIPLLSSLTEAAFRRLLAAIVIRRLPPGDLAIRQGEAGTAFYLVASGELRVVARDGLGRATELARLGENAVFGEMALLSAQPRLASVEAVTEADLLEVGRAALAGLADELPAVAEALHAFTRERLLANLMATNPLFRPFTRVQQRDLLRRFTSHDVVAGTVIIREGEEGRGLFVVLAGELEVGARGVPLGTLRAGEVFGEMSLLRGAPTAATVSAIGSGTVLFLAREYVARLVAVAPELRAYLEALADDREVDNQLTLGEDPAAADERVLV
jgi:CRP-like cAMP-binding protein